MKYLVTVICLTYNHEKYIEKTLNGFLKQKTTFPVEYIIRDDASTDNTANILHEYERKYPGYFNIIYEKENQYSKNIIPYFSQKVIMETKSKYVALCEGDDYWCDDNKLQKQVDLMEKNPSASFCVHANYELNDKTGKMKKRHPYKKSGVLSIEEVLIEPGGMPATCSMLMRTEYINQYPVYDLPCPVGDRSRRMFLIDKGPALYIDDLMCVYRVNNSNSFGGQLYNYNKSIKLVELLNYSFKEQMIDIFPSVTLAVVMGIAISFINFFEFSSALTLLIKVPTGALIYIFGSKLLHLDSFEYLLEISKTLIHKK